MTTKTTINPSGVNLEVTGRYVSTVLGFPFESTDQNYHNKFKIRIKNLDTGKSFISDFYGSAHDCEQHKEELDRADLLGALDCIVNDALYYLEDDFQGFCDNLGYDEDSRKAERIYKACGKTAAKFERIGITEDDMGIILTYLHDDEGV